MKEELTNEMLEVMKMCSFNCALCGVNGVCDKYDWQDTIQTLAAALLEERAKPKDDVWEYATMRTDRVVLYYYEGDNLCAAKTYTRELPKTRTRIMAEEIASTKISNEANLIDIIEQTIKNHFAELKEES